MIEVIKATKSRKHMDKGTRGAESKMIFLRKHLYASRVEKYGERDTEEARRGSNRGTSIKGKEK